jgi:hypothetical protein
VSSVGTGRGGDATATATRWRCAQMRCDPRNWAVEICLLGSGRCRPRNLGPPACARRYRLATTSEPLARLHHHSDVTDSSAHPQPQSTAPRCVALTTYRSLLVCDRTRLAPRRDARGRISTSDQMAIAAPVGPIQEQYRPHHTEPPNTPIPQPHDGRPQASIRTGSVPHSSPTSHACSK